MVRADYVLRTEHSTTALHLQDQTLYTGTEQGHVTVYNTDLMRPVISWQAHSQQVLAIAGTEHGILTQGREGSLAVWKSGLCVQKCNVPCTGFCCFSLSPGQKWCYLGIDENSKVCFEINLE